MSALREAAQQALEALEDVDGPITALLGGLLGSPDADAPGAKVRIAITTLKAALAQGQAEPVAWMQPRTVDGYLRPDLGYETCSSADYGAFPVYRAPPKAEPAQEPVAWVEHEWSGTGSRKLHFEKRDPTVRDEVVNPVWTPLYTDPPKRQPLSGLEAERLLEQVIGSLPAARNLVRAVERAHGIIEPRIKEDSHQTLDAAMQQPRAMAQAYESGYKAGAAAERKRIIQFLQEMQRQVGDGHNHYGVAAVRIKERI